MADDTALLEVLTSEAEAMRLGGHLHLAVDLLAIADVIGWRRRPEPIRRKLLLTRSRCLTGLGAPNQGRLLAEKALQFGGSSSDVAGSTIVIANAVLAAGSGDGTIHAILEAVPWRRRGFRGTHPVEAGVLHFLWASGFTHGDHPRAEREYKAARGLLNSAGNRRGEAMCVANLGRLYFQAGRFLDAETMMVEAAAGYVATEDEWGHASALVGRADAMLARALSGSPTSEALVAEAIQHYQAAQKLWRGNQHMLPRLLENLSVAQLMLGRAGDARRLTREADGIRRARTRRIAGISVQVQDDFTYVQRLPASSLSAARS